MEVTVDGHILCCQPFWMAAITKNHKNDCHGSMLENRDLQQTPRATKFGSIFNLNMLSAISWQPCWTAAKNNVNVIAVGVSTILSHNI